MMEVGKVGGGGMVYRWGVLEVFLIIMWFIFYMYDKYVFGLFVVYVSIVYKVLKK